MIKPGISKGSIDDITGDMFSADTGELVYIIERDPKDIIKKYESIKMPKFIVGSYSLNSKHCLVLFVTGIIKKRKK